jgi:hypothetical protein
MAMEAGGAGTRLRPLGLSDVLDETFRVYRRQFRAFVTVIGLVAVPSSLISIAFVVAFGAFDFQALARGGNSSQMLTTLGVMVAVALPLGILYGLARLVAGAAAVQVASDAILGLTPNVGAAYREAFGRLWALLGGGFLPFLATGLLVMTCIGIPFAIYIGLGWALIVPLIMLEGMGMSAAMGRSWELVRGHRWRLLIALFLIGLITYLLVSIPSGLFSFVGNILVFALHAGQWGTVAVSTGNVLFGTLGETLFGSIIYIALTLFYYDLRIRKEAFDLQQRAASAEFSAGTSQGGYAAGAAYPGQAPYPSQDWAGPPSSPPPTSPRRPLIPPPPLAPPDA